MFHGSCNVLIKTDTGITSHFLTTKQAEKKRRSFVKNPITHTSSVQSTTKRY